jgi:hypothetical protein
VASCASCTGVAPGRRRTASPSSHGPALSRRSARPRVLGAVGPGTGRALVSYVAHSCHTVLLLRRIARDCAPIARQVPYSGFGMWTRIALTIASSRVLRMACFVCTGARNCNLPTAHGLSSGALVPGLQHAEHLSSACQALVKHLSSGALVPGLL